MQAFIHRFLIQPVKAFGLQRYLSPWGLCLLAILVFLAPSLVHWLNRLELLSFEERQGQIQENRHHTGITLVEIDRGSLNNIEIRKAFGRYPWRRSIYAYLIRYFQRTQPKALMMELSFSGGEDIEHPEADQFFLASIQPGFPFGSALTEAVRKEVQGVESPEARLLMFKKLREELLSLPQLPPAASREYDAMQLPMGALLQRSGKVFPLNNLVYDENGRVRQTYLFANGAVLKYFPTFPLGILTLDGSKPTFELPGTLRIQDRVIHTRGEDKPIIRWVGYIHGMAKGEASEVYPRYSLWQLVKSQLWHECHQGHPPEVCGKIDFKGFEPVSPERFANRYILVGYYSDWFDATKHSTLYDMKSIEQLKYPNLYIQANILDNLLSDQFVQRPPLRIPAPSIPGGSVSLVTILTVAFCFATVFVLTMRLRNLAWSALITGIFCAFYSFITVQAYQHGSLWLNWIYPTLTLLLTFFGALFVRVNRAEKQRRQLRMTFAKYISPINMAFIEKHPDRVQLGSHKKELTFLFCDMRGFTALAEQHSPQVVQEILDAYYGQINSIILNRYGGVISKLMGDALLAYWGFPLDSPHDALMAVSAALEMKDVMSKWALTLDPGLPPIRIGIGINTGEAMIGNVGSVDFMDFTVIGDAVNTAARLEKLNKHFGTTLIISKSTYEQVKDHIEARSLGEIRVRGKADPIEVFEPLSVKPTASTPV